jgi:methylthioribose-1-phosphate isomerase
MKDSKLSTVQPLQWTGTILKVLDQRQLPTTLCYTEYHDANGVAEAIKSMQVRGAPAIGIAAAYGVVLSVMQHSQQSNWHQLVEDDMNLLANARPTAVNLSWALQQMRQALLKTTEHPVSTVLACAEKIHQDDIAANHKMGELGASVAINAKGVLTHCNTGALATGGYGTALGVIRSLNAGKPLNIFATETRPWQQGLRLTAWELAEDSIPVTMIADSTAAWLMKIGAIDWIIVGADRIALNGDVANKIGTYSLAVLAKHHHVKVMVVAPTSTIDSTISNGQYIEIEEREPQEFLPECYQGNQFIGAWNPVFDVTPAELISAIVTERGVVINPGSKGVADLVKEIG